MLKIREEIIQIAASQVGQSEEPKNSNSTKYGRWFGFDNVPWCAMFVSWVFARAKIPFQGMDYVKGFAGCQSAVKHFKATGQTTTSPEPGDLVFFDFNADGRFDHVGIFVSKKSSDYFETIEGNTSISNQNNGGAVMIRKRIFSKNLIFVKPSILK